MMFNTRFHAATVAQSFTLLYRRVALCEARDDNGPSEARTRSRLQVGDTAEWNSALLRVACTAAFTLLLGIAQTSAADSESPGEKERQLIAVLKSAAPPQDKAIPCKQLAVYGSKKAVPVLAALLSNGELASWARIALEAIPDPEADAALRNAIPKLHGKLLVGVINSIGYRHDAKAVGSLVKKLKDDDVQVASAAAVALGHIGGSKAAQALTASLTHGAIEVRSAAAEGCVL